MISLKCPRCDKADGGLIWASFSNDPISCEVCTYEQNPALYQSKKLERVKRTAKLWAETIGPALRAYDEKSRREWREKFGNQQVGKTKGTPA